ncbi:MAG: hypothetical protein AUK48_06955 [Oscillatoriales cyanobacterium CG2_30_44_21]|nr:MAG: hypothetical protein AUK48_06955 [Oscillatoriales cyanobacterium CG2_30_44_21]
MATPRSEQPEKHIRRKKKQPKRFRISYSFLLLLLMLIVGSVTGLVAYSFGKQALEGVNPSPSGIKLPKINPNTKESPKALPKKGNEDKTSFFLNESELVAESKARTQLDLGKLTRPVYQSKTSGSDRQRIYTRVDQAFNSMRDPLAVSASADQRIAEKIAALRQRVYTNGQINERNTNSFVEVKSAVSTESRSSSQWQDRELSPNNRQIGSEVTEINSKPTNTIEVTETSIPINELNRR